MNPKKSQPQNRRLADRLKESYFHPRYLAFRELQKIVRQEGPLLSGRLLDVGCGKKPYRQLLPRVGDYIGLDVPGSMHGIRSVEVLGTNQALPFAAACFDSILCTEVLEHSPAPLNVLLEMNRVTRPGGRLLLTIPFSEQLHEEPYDFFRFTHYGIEHLLAQSGWQVERIRRRGGTFLELGYRTSSFLYSAIGAWKDDLGQHHPRKVIGPLVIVICALIQMFASLLDSAWEIKLSTIGYGIVARKTKLPIEIKLPTGRSLPVEDEP